MNILNKIKELQVDNDRSVFELYSNAKRSLIILLLLTSAIMIALYPLLHKVILLWYVPLILLILYRLNDVDQFEKISPDVVDIHKWYKQFKILAYMTAVLYASLGFIYIYFVDAYYQLFILSVIIGLASGATFVLSSDIRLSINYLSILLLPLVITLLFLPNMPLNIILAGTLFLQYIAQITILNHIYTHHNKLKDVESKHEVLDNFFRKAPLGMLTYDKDLTITNCNQELSSLFKTSQEKIIGMNLKDLPDQRPIPAIQDAFSENVGFYKGEYISLYGEHFFMEMKAFSYQKKPLNELVGIAVIEDKTKEYAALVEMEYMVEHDALTSLLNRRGFKNKMNALLLEEKHSEYYSILFYLDLNGFKRINDSLGHTVGDQILMIISRRLSESVSNDCIISRLGGDEFIIVVPHVANNKESTYEKSKDYIKTIKDVFIEPCIVNNIPLHIDTSIGIVMAEPNTLDIDEIIRHADLSMYKAKEDMTHIAYYDFALDKKQKDLFLLQQQLGSAMENNELKLFFQPVVQMKDEKLLSAEMLLRWHHADQGLITPNIFIDLAIKAGLLSKMTWWIIKTVCQKIQQWKEEGRWQLNYISINVNSAQLLESDFAKLFFEILKTYKIRPSEIVIEITERSLIDNFSHTQGVVNELRSHGIKCAIDDFGTGYSSLSYLKKLSLDTLKIDREFIKNIGGSPKELLLVSTIIDIGRQFNYNIIVEGIESEEQKSLLLELDEKLTYQGYYFSKPISTEAFEQKFLRIP